jgi:hypothetical protein
MHSYTRWVLSAMALSGAVLVIDGHAAAAAASFAGCALSPAEAPMMVDVPDSYVSSGEAIHLHNTHGQVNPFDASWNEASVPMCTIFPDGEGGYRPAQWSFCTDYFKPSCGQHTMTPKAAPALSPLQQSRVTWVVENGNTMTNGSRYVVAQQIWCITEGLASGAPVIEANSFYPTCPNWEVDIDPMLPLAPSVAVTRTVASATTGTPIEFVVTANTPQATIEVAGGSAALCPTEITATMTGSVISLNGAASAKLCVNRSDAGDVTVAATSSTLRSNVSFWTAAGGCQGFVTASDKVTASAQSSATASWTAPLEVPTTAPAPTTVPEPAPSVSVVLPTIQITQPAQLLPATGKSSGGMVSLAFAALGLGLVSLVVARRPRPLRLK